MITLIKKVTLLIIIISTSSFAQQPNFSQLDEFLNILEENNKLMGAMTIKKDGKEVYDKAVGFSEVEIKAKLNRNTKFRIGSVTKTFTAVMIFQLIDEGQLALDTPLSKFFPKVPQASTIRMSHLLSHSSGLFNITNASDIDEWIYKPLEQKQMLARIESYDLDFDAGTQTEYSNTNYILLGFIIENLDKRTYKESLEHRIANKIGLQNTYFGGKINSQNYESQSYVNENGKWIKQAETNLTNPGGAGAIVSTSEDLALFMNALFDGKLMSSSSFKAMKTTNNQEVCHGLFYAKMNGMDIYLSEGGIDGFQSLLMHVPSAKTTIALTANGLDFAKIRILLSAFASSQGKSIVLPNFGTIELTQDQAKQYEGEYTCEEVPFKLVFKAEGNTLMGSRGQSDSKPLTPTKQHQFTLNALGVVLDFYPESGVLKFTEGGNQPLIFNKQ